MNAWWQNVLFYDAPEYLKIVNENSFIKSLSLGHNPIHPVFNGLLWLGMHLFQSANFTALVFGILSALIFYRLLRSLFNRRKSILGLILYLLFPAVYIISTNLMVESVCLFLFVLTLFWLIKGHLIPVCVTVALMVGAHIETIVWLPAIFSFLLLVKHTKNIKKVILYTMLGIILGIFCYWGQPLSNLFFARVGEHFGPVSGIAILRMGRNIYLSLVRGFGTLPIFLLVFVAIFKVKTRQEKIALGLLTLPVIVSGAIWTGDFMPRRLIFAAFIFSFYLSEIFK